MVEKTLILSDADVKQCITMKEVFDSVEDTFTAYGNGELIMPAKITLDIRKTGTDSWLNAMPGYINTTKAMGIKWAGGFAGNAEKGLNYIQSTVILNDHLTGQALSIVNGLSISNMRTGCAAAVTAKYSAKKDSKVVAIIGAGMQSRMSLMALTFCFEMAEVRVADINPAAAKAFAVSFAKDYNLNMVVSTDNKAAVDNADIIVTATHADEALVDNDWIAKGATVLPLGSYQEIDEEFVLTADKIIVDNWDQCSHRGELKKAFEAGRISKANLTAELGEVIVGKKVGRSSDSDRVLAVPVGLGSLDVAIVQKVSKSAREKNIGVLVDF